MRARALASCGAPSTSGRCPPRPVVSRPLAAARRDVPPSSSSSLRCVAPRRAAPSRLGCHVRETAVKVAVDATVDERAPAPPDATDGDGKSEGEPSEAEALRRKRISEAMKRRWRNDEAYASKVSKGRSGIEPWNKGKRLSEGHKTKIASAKVGAKHSKETRRKMSTSHKRRHTAVRVLQSVDRIVQQQQGASSPPPGRGQAAATADIDGAQNHQKKVLVSKYKSMLHDFRVLEGEIEPWVSQFLSEHGRKPNLVDVQATKMDWLIQKYKKYNLMKQQLVVQIPGIRGQMRGSGGGAKAGARAMADQAEAAKQAKLSAFFSAVSTSRAASIPAPPPSSGRAPGKSNGLLPTTPKDPLDTAVNTKLTAMAKSDDARVTAALAKVRMYKQQQQQQQEEEE